MNSCDKQMKRLQTLMEVSVIISSTLDFKELITLVMEKAKEVMDAEASSVLLYNKESDKLEFEVALNENEVASKKLTSKIVLNMGEGIAGWVAMNKKSLVIKDVVYDERFSQRADKTTGFTTRSIIAVPLMGRKGLIGVAEVINPVAKGSFTKNDLKIFETLCRQVSVAMENARFHEESIKRERLKRELEIASSLQKSFFPPSPFFSKERIDVTACNIMASQVGGDIYDFIDFHNNKIGILIGDVSGKGVSAALYMAKAISDFRHMAVSFDSVDSVMSEINKSLFGYPMGMFLTAIYLTVDIFTGELKITSAGHPPPLLISDGVVQTTELKTAPPLGIVSTEFPVNTIKMQKGDRLLLFTDGVFDVKNREGERAGFERVVDFIETKKNEENIIENIIEFTREFSRDTQIPDDITIVDLRFE